MLWYKEVLKKWILPFLSVTEKNEHDAAVAGDKQSEFIQNNNDNQQSNDSVSCTICMSALLWYNTIPNLLPSQKNSDFAQPKCSDYFNLYIHYEYFWNLTIIKMIFTTIFQTEKKLSLFMLQWNSHPFIWILFKFIRIYIIYCRIIV